MSSRGYTQWGILELCLNEQAQQPKFAVLWVVILVSATVLFFADVRSVDDVMHQVRCSIIMGRVPTEVYDLHTTPQQPMQPCPAIAQHPLP